MNIKEILVLHHSHLDVGYTHSQPVLWELQREFIDLALDLLEETRTWPEESKPRWTVEVTAQIMHWMKTADETKLRKIKKAIDENLFGFSGMEYNTTPLCNNEQLFRQLQNIKILKKELGIEINTVHQHDVNGITWAQTDNMLDAGIELLVMGINLHFGGYAVDRPSVFRWKAPSGREITVVNGEHYTMFDQLLYSWENSTDRMAEGLAEYCSILEKKNYPHDFLYLTTADTPVSWDNSPPNISVAKLIRQWNEEERSPRIRFVTPNMLHEKIKSIPEENIPVYRGDWTDYWNFGAASSARETALNSVTKRKLGKAELLHAFSNNYSAAVKDTVNRAWNGVNIYDEHTWGASNSMESDHQEVYKQWNLKAAQAYEANALSDYSLIDGLEKLTGNPSHAQNQDGIIVVNLTGETARESVFIPDDWIKQGKRNRTSRMTESFRDFRNKEGQIYGPLTVPPFSWKKVSFTDLTTFKKDNHLVFTQNLETESKRILNSESLTSSQSGYHSIENEFHRLEVNNVNGRITSLFDKKLKKEILNTNSRWGFFEPVHEQPDPLFDNRREALYDRDLDKERHDISCWKTDWRPKRQGAVKVIDSRIEEKPDRLIFHRSYAFPGTETFEQSITIKSHSDVIDLNVKINKIADTNPEAVYFAFPLSLDSGWKAQFDNAGQKILLDDDQLPGSCKDWVTAENYGLMYDKNIGASLFCSEAPLIQFGDFNFGKKSVFITREKDPLLLSWPMNNYWNTNFRAAQPGWLNLNYSFTTFNSTEAGDQFRKARNRMEPLLIHPAIDVNNNIDGTFLKIENDKLIIEHVKPAEEKNSLIIRINNTSDFEETGIISFPGKTINKVYTTDLFEEKGELINFLGNSVTKFYPPKKITSMIIRFKEGR